jgi:hypothetical protein
MQWEQRWLDDIGKSFGVLASLNKKNAKIWSSSSKSPCYDTSTSTS